MEVGDRDLFNPNAMRDGMHDWVLANEQHGEGAGGEGISLSVCVCAECAGTWIAR